jgi:hypothetical protein
LRRILLFGLALILFSMSIVAVSEFVYGTAQHTFSQKATVIAKLMIQNTNIGNIEEGESKTYSKATESSLSNALSLKTTVDNVYLNFTSDLGSLNIYYSTYNITIKYATVGSGSIHSVGDTACVMTLASPRMEVTLDKTGVWSFDLEITTIAKSVSSNQAISVTIKVTAESS